MQRKKLSLANVQGKLSRVEMKSIMAGSGDDRCPGSCDGACTLSGGGNGNCQKGKTDPSKCYCISIY